MNSLHVKTGDIVEIISGESKGKRGKVLEVSPKEKKVIVEGCNMCSKHVKPRKMGQAGGIIEAEAPLYASKVMLVCPKCDKTTRAGHKIGKDGKKVRVCKCGNEF